MKKKNIKTSGSYTKEEINGVLIILILFITTGLLSKIKLACELVGETDAHFVKTSTGFSNGGATIRALEIMRQYFDRGVKMSGGVKLGNLKELLNAVSGRIDGVINLNPNVVRIGESSLLNNL